MTAPKHQAARMFSAPGDALRTWWDELTRVQKWGFGVIGFAVMALLPIYTPSFLNTPGVSFDGVMAQFAMIALVAIGLNVVVGQAGLLDLGYVGFYAVGAYTVALLTSPQSPWNQLSAHGMFSKDWAWLSCVPLAMAYKAINTLDSMVGYKNQKYKAIGCVSARIDDLANLIPARLSWLLLTGAAALMRLNVRNAFRIGWRDRYQHKSPNCGWPEATVAGALGVRLGGPNSYFGELVEKPWIGDEQREINQQDIKLTIRLMFIASAIALMLFSIVYWMFH